MGGQPAPQPAVDTGRDERADQQPSLIATRPKRADARRNYDRLLNTARNAFLERGTDVPLEDIAREACVGIGTLYRHFPARQDLMEAVFLDRVEMLRELSTELIDSSDPGAALEQWLRALIQFSNDFRGLSRSLLLSDEGKDTKKSCHGILVDVAESLVERAKQAGAIRTDVTAGVILKLTNGIAVAVEHLDQPDADRVLAVMMDGMRHTGAEEA